jgi:hypothetical protein
MSGFARSGHELNCEKDANGHFRTHAAQQAASSLNHLVGAGNLGRFRSSNGVASTVVNHLDLAIFRSAPVIRSCPTPAMAAACRTTDVA